MTSTDSNSNDAYEVSWTSRSVPQGLRDPEVRELFYKLHASLVEGGYRGKSVIFEVVNLNGGTSVEVMKVCNNPYVTFEEDAGYVLQDFHREHGIQNLQSMRARPLEYPH